jgi:hypothetical protein
VTLFGCYALGNSKKSTSNGSVTEPLPEGRHP